MVSSSRWAAASSTSSCSSPSEVQKTAGVDRRESERELARRVLEDLEGLYFDEDSEDESEDDEFDSGSEWGPDKSSRGRAGGKSAGGMTLEELTVAVNAAIEYHLPTKSVVENDSVEHSPCKPNERSSRCFESRHPSRHQRKSLSRESFQGGESELGFFQEILERKERQFYAMKAAAEKKELQDRQLQETAQSALATVIQQRQTATYLRDQATETEEWPHYAKFDAPFATAEFETPPPHSVSQSVSSGDDPVASELSVAVGPTLADLVKSRRRLQRPPSRKPSSSSRSSWSSSSSSSYHALQSEHSSISNRSSSSSSSACSNRASSKSPATSSKRSTHSSHGGEYQPTGLSREPSIDTPSEWHNTVPGGELQATPSRAIPDPQVPHSPALVSWELDLSNFTP